MSFVQKPRARASTSSSTVTVWPLATDTFLNAFSSFTGRTIEATLSAT